ncbi:MAG TPA: serine/threonine-protein kinase, partial [Polyangiaceae bacterium]
MSDPIGTTLAGKYLIKRLVGRGGMGAVFEGTHTEIGKRVAIKIIEPQHAGSEEVASRFRREARAASAVESDAIVQVFDVGQDPAVGLFMVMEFLNGEDLSTRLERERKLAPEVVVALGLQASRALAKAHAAGVVHRDLKPANVFLCATEDGSLKIKIVDFGISKLVQSEASPDASAHKTLTRTGTVIGTPQYMSPEQAQGLPVDARTDVWSLGAVLYEALAGVGAFPEMPTYEQTIIKIVTGQPKPLGEIAPWVSPELAEVVHASLTHDPEKRLPDCATFAQKLGELQKRASSAQIVVAQLTEHEVASATIRGATPATPPSLGGAPGTVAGVSMSAAANRRSRAPLAALGVVVAIAAAIGGAVLLRAKPDGATVSGTAPALGSNTQATPVSPSAPLAPSTAVAVPSASV